MMEGSQTMKSIVHRIPITRARINLGQVVRRAHVNREYFILEKDGIPVAGIMNVDDFEDYLDLQDPGLKRQIRKSHAEYRRGKARHAGKLLTGLRRAAAKSKKQITRMAGKFRVVTTPAFEREFRKASKRNAALLDAVEELLAILREDPHNRSGQHKIKKLAGLKPGDGQWRIR